MKLRSFIIFIVALAACRRGERVRYEKAPVVLISIDTVRADHLPAYGYRNVDTPHLDAFRRDAILFQNAYAHCPMTLPSHLSMLTGLLPTDHGVRDNAGFHFDGAQHPSLPRLLHDRGYATGAAVSSYVLRSETGLGPLFDAYDDATNARAGAAFVDYQRRGDVTESVAEKWIDAHGSAPFFYFFHIYEPHVPYEPPEPFRSRYASAYDGEIATADAIVGKLLDHLKAKGIYDRAIIIVCSDHGEGLNDHGEDQHSILIYREAIHVPLMLKLPSSKRANTSIDAPAQLADIFGTVLQLTGIETKASSLLELPASRRIYSESFYARYHFGWSELRSLIDDRYHLIASTTRAELYDVKADLNEHHDIAANERRIVSADREALEKFGHAIPQPAAVDPETAAKLQALGYLGNARNAAGPLPDPNQAIATLAPMRKAIELAAAHRTDESLALFREILAKAPGMVEVWTQYADTLAAAGQLDDAIAAYREAIAHSPVASPDLILPLGSLYLQAGKLDDAQHAGEVTLASNPHRAKTLLAGVALARRDYDTATRYAQDVADEPEGLLLLARIADERGDYAGALRIADDVQRMAAGRELLPVFRLDFVRADALARLGRIDEARAAYQREIKSFPNDLRAYTNLAVLQFLGGDRAGADATLRAMVSANPGAAARALAKRTRDML